MAEGRSTENRPASDVNRVQSFAKQGNTIIVETISDLAILFNVELTFLSAAGRPGAALVNSTPTCRAPSPAGRGGVANVHITGHARVTLIEISAGSRTPVHAFVGYYSESDTALGNLKLYIESNSSAVT